MMNIEYHDPKSCNMCSGENATFNEIYDSGVVAETGTKCSVCGHIDYWAYGFYESSAEIKSNCNKYINDNGKLKPVT